VTAIRVLVVDDEPDMLENCRRLLERAGFAVRVLSEPTAVRQVLEEFRPEIALVDLRMPGADGMTVLAVVLAEDPSIPVVMMTAFATVGSAVQAIREGAFDYLAKPFSAEQLVATVERAARYRGGGAAPGRGAVQGGATEIIGTSPSIVRLQAEIRKVAASPASVLIFGESGTGKELVARAIHNQSARKARPLLPIDCAALPEQLLENELFGHERGAFTGAVGRKTGLLVEGSGGTVFLDEIGDLSQVLQAKLLRVLEDHQVRPIGSTTYVPTDIRVIAATNVDLGAAVASGRFRADLYYRLDVIQLRLPPLRQRPEDLEPLFQYFLATFASELGRPAPRVSPEAWAALTRHPWPGNVRELRNLAQRLTVLDDDGRVTLADLPDAIRGWSDAVAGEATGVPPEYDAAREEAMLDFRRTYLRRLLDYHRGNVTRAAMAAGVSRRTLHRWLAEDGSDVPDPEDFA